MKKDGQPEPLSYLFWDLNNSIPQIFFDDQHIGGYDEVRALEKENKLKDLLK